MCKGGFEDVKALCPMCHYMDHVVLSFALWSAVLDWCPCVCECACECVCPYIEFLCVLISHSCAQECSE